MDLRPLTTTAHRLVGAVRDHPERARDSAEGKENEIEGEHHADPKVRSEVSEDVGRLAAGDNWPAAVSRSRVSSSGQSSADGPGLSPGLRGTRCVPPGSARAPPPGDDMTRTPLPPSWMRAQIARPGPAPSEKGRACAGRAPGRRGGPEGRCEGLAEQEKERRRDEQDVSGSRPPRLSAVGRASSHRHRPTSGPTQPEQRERRSRHQRDDLIPADDGHHLLVAGRHPRGAAAVRSLMETRQWMRSSSGG